MHLSEQEKNIYNEYLRASRKNKPFRPRKDFEKLDDDTKIVVHQLRAFFDSFPAIRVRDFFEAGFNDIEYQPIEFFKSLRAIKKYNVYIADKIANIDSDWFVEFARESLLFVYSFCKDNNIAVSDYINCRAPSGIPWCIIHLKELKICLFLILAFPGGENKLFEYSSDIRDYLGDEFLRELPKHRAIFLRSTKSKDVLLKGVQLITKTKTTQHKIT